MKIGFQLRMMLIAVSKERWRMALAVGAVAIGLAAVMILMSLSAGAKLEMRGILSQVGVNVITITPAQVQAVSNRGGAWYLSEKIVVKDMLSIAKSVDGIRAVTPEIEESLTVQYKGANLRTTVKGTGMDFPAIRNFAIGSGRYFSSDDDAGNKRVAVLGSFAVEKLNDGFSMLNETIWIGGVAFKVIGQFEQKGLSDSGTNYDDLIVVPYSTARTRLYSRDFLDRVLLLPGEGEDIDTIIGGVRDVLRSNHAIDEGEKDDFVVLKPSTSDLVKQTTNELLGGLAWFFTVITLTIGGAGVFSVSYLNVLDRRGEIGLRVALGATRHSIVVLFLSEALLLSAIGCIAGLVLGVIAILLFTAWTEWRMAIDLSVIVIPAIVSVVLGVAFGVLPAYKASRMTPVEALRAG